MHSLCPLFVPFLFCIVCVCRQPFVAVFLACSRARLSAHSSPLSSSRRDACFRCCCCCCDGSCRAVCFRHCIVAAVLLPNGHQCTRLRSAQQTGLRVSTGRGNTGEHT